MKKTIRAVLLMLMVCASLDAAAQSVTDRARALLAQKQPKEAYALLLPLESQRAGEPDFDYLLGIAALDSGEPERAIFALERVLAVQPNNALARAEIGRAYLVSGEKESAKREFEAVRSNQQVPADARITVERFLAAMAAAETTQITGFVEATIGADSNVNAATSNGQIAIPGLGIATLNAGATQKSANFLGVTGGVNVTHRLTPDWSLLAGAAAGLRFNSGASQFDTGNLDGNVGLRRTIGQRDAVTVGLQGQSFYLNDARYRDSIGGVAQWQHNYNDRQQASLFGQYTQLRYPGQSLRDADRSIIGVAYAHVLSVPMSPVVFASLYGGKEDVRAAGVPHLGHDPFGVRLGGQLRLGGGWALFANASYEERRYGGADPIFLVTRNDKQTDVGAGVNYLLTPGLTITGQVSHTENRSNVALNQFRRSVGSVSVRYSF